MTGILVNISENISESEQKSCKYKLQVNKLNNPNNKLRQEIASKKSLIFFFFTGKGKKNHEFVIKI